LLDPTLTFRSAVVHSATPGVADEVGAGVVGAELPLLPVDGVAVTVTVGVVVGEPDEPHPAARVATDPSTVTTSRRRTPGTQDFMRNILYR
jgi:hypothetical protein